MGASVAFLYLLSRLADDLSLSHEKSASDGKCYLRARSRRHHSI
jgi:hypothetical protein